MALMQYHFTSNILELSVSLNIIVPNVIEENKKYKVLYLLHGYMGNHTDWLRYTSIERYNWEYNMIIVMPDGHQSYYTDYKYGFPYFTHLAEELPKHLALLLPISEKREDHYICGLSMGGYGALKIALTFPEKFGSVASLSGALDPEETRKIVNNRSGMFYAMYADEPIAGTKNDLKHLIKENIKHQKPMPDIFLACGKEDFLYDSTLQFKAFLDEMGVSHTYLEDKGGHMWSFWDLFIQKYLRHIKKGH
jgi:putative tributyrin esterase